jgi:hypothetical protein
MEESKAATEYETALEQIATPITLFGRSKR